MFSFPPHLLYWHLGHYIVDALQILKEVDLRDKRVGLLLLIELSIRETGFCVNLGLTSTYCMFFQRPQSEDFVL